MKRVIFLHGLNWSGACDIADELRRGLRGIAEVVSPDLPANPAEALATVRGLCDMSLPDLIVGSSYGAFIGQQLVKIIGCPALLCSPMFDMSGFVSGRIGTHRYKSVRASGETDYTITSEIVDAFREMERHQFDCYDPYYRDRVRGFFGSLDRLATSPEEFREYYSHTVEYEGLHTMSRANARDILVPAAKEMLARYPRSECRRFVHYKGNPYEMICHARGSEDLSRQVVYRALYGGRGCWVRPERMFFERVTRADGSVVPRFAEVSVE